MMRFVKRGLAFLGKSLLVLFVLGALGVGGGIWYFRQRAATAPGVPSGDVAVPRGTRAIELWFPDARAAGLVLETREVVEDALEGDALVRTVVDEWLRGPADAAGRAAVPEGVTLAHVYRDPGGGLYLDFSAELKRRFQGGSSAEYLLVASLLRTVSTNAPAVARVTITAGGQPLATLGGHVRLDGPLVVSEWR